MIQGTSEIDEPVCLAFERIEQGEPVPIRHLFSHLYEELHRMAGHQLARYGGAVTIGPGTLLHKAYISLAERTGPSFPDEPRFMGYVARVMRGLIIDHARSRRVLKRGGQFAITGLATDAAENPANERELEQISEALDELAKWDESLAELVDLKFFCGFSFAEIAERRGVSERTVQRNWEKARIYLHRSIRPDV